jgi:hypothetical protein
MKVRKKGVTTRRSYWCMPPARSNSPVRRPIGATRAAADVTHPLSVRNVTEACEIGFRQLARRLGEFAEQASPEALPSIIAAQAIALDYADFLEPVLSRERQIERLTAEAEDVLASLQAGQEEYLRAVDGKIQDLRNLDRDSLLRASTVAMSVDARYEAGALIDPFPPGAHDRRAAELLHQRNERAAGKVA